MNGRRKELMLAVIISIASYCLVHGQIPSPPSNLQSPNVASLGLYGNYPVSYFTGLPQISIPLYNVKSGNLSVPITLNYHAAGIRPDEHPGWVGMGWNLESGGVISRTVNDMPDDYNNPNNPFGSNAGFYFNYNVLNTSNWNQIVYMHSVTSGELMYKDTEPDEFSFSLPSGTNGKFYRTHTGDWKVRCEKPVKVSFNNTFLNVPYTPPYTTEIFPSFSGFTITDENGVQYVFGGVINAIEYSIPLFNQNEGVWIANSWYLTKIIHPHGDEISFQYTRDSFIDQMFISVNNDLGTRTVSSGGSNPVCYSDGHRDLGASYFGTLISPVYLTTIINGKEQINFQRSNTTELRYAQSLYDWQYSQWQIYTSSRYYSLLPFLEDHDWSTYPTCLDKLQWKQLDQIRIEVDGTLQKAFDFGYSSSNSQRLTLLSLTERGKDNGLLKPYAFTYNTSQTLPAYLANKNDHWGFYNGTYADISNQGTYYNTYYNYRNPNASYLQAGTISRIIYPTGGVTDFTFEPHYYRKQLQGQRELVPVTLSSNTLAGGLRIRKISSYDPEHSEQKVEKEYFYVEGYTNAANVSSLQSSGILGGQIKYYFDDYRVNPIGVSGVTYSKSLFSSQSVLPANYNSQGSHIGYSTVVEKRNDGSYTVYDFSNFDNPNYRDIQADNLLQVQRNIYEPYSSRDLCRGKLLSEYSYNNSDVPLRKRLITYAPINESNEQVRSLKATRFKACKESQVDVEEGTAYRYFTYAFLPSSETITEYDQNGENPMTILTTYTYDTDYRLLKQENTTDSKGISYQTTYRYPFDVRTGFPLVSQPVLYPLSWMIEKHIIGEPIEKIVTHYQSGVERVVSADVTVFSGIDVFLKTVYPTKKYRFNAMGAIPMSSYIPYKVNATAPYEFVTIDPNLIVSEEYSYNVLETSGGHVLRPIQFRPLKGPFKSYLWGYDQKYAIAEVSNENFAQAAYSSFEGAEKGNWIYSGTPTADLTAPTGKKAYNLSGGAISRSDLTTAKAYLLTYWAKSTSAAAISGGTATVVRSYNGWTLYSRKVSGISTIQLSGSVMVDDVRLYGYEGGIKGYTYNELGSATSISDDTGNVQYYEYDEFNRLKTVKDSQGRILKHYNYNLK